MNTHQDNEENHSCEDQYPFLPNLMAVNGLSRRIAMTKKPLTVVSRLK